MQFLDQLQSDASGDAALAIRHRSKGADQASGTHASGAGPSLQQQYPQSGTPGGQGGGTACRTGTGDDQVPSIIKSEFGCIMACRSIHVFGYIMVLNIDQCFYKYSLTIDKTYV
jgi:hypothetical protein